MVDFGDGRGENTGVGMAETIPNQAPADKDSDDMATPTPKRTTSPAFQFYPKDFLSSSKVGRMSLTERGAYITLLAHCWLDHVLPAEPVKLAAILGLRTDRFERMWNGGALAECFVLRKEGLINERLESEREKQNEYRARQAVNGKKGGRPFGKPKPNPSLTQPVTQTKPKKRSPISVLRTPISVLHKEQEQEQEQEQNPPRLLLDIWNATITSLSKCQAFTQDRLRAERARLSEQPDVTWWASVVARMEASDFLTGRKSSHDHAGWRADVDWWLKPGNAAKVMEGKYDNPAQAPQPLTWAQRRAAQGLS